jgi:hypothetical protein
MSEEEKKGQMIYHYHARIGWRKKKGNGYVNNYKDIEFVSRAADLEMMNNDPDFIMQIMSNQGLTGSSISNFGVTKIYKVEEVGRSFYYKED